MSSNEKIRVKNTVIDPYLVPHQADLTAAQATVVARYVPIVKEIEVLVENRTSTSEETFYWDGTESEFQQLMTAALAQAVSKFKRQLQHNAYLDSILFRRTT